MENVLNLGFSEYRDQLSCPTLMIVGRSSTSRFAWRRAIAELAWRSLATRARVDDFDRLGFRGKASVGRDPCPGGDEFYSGQSTLPSRRGFFL